MAGLESRYISYQDCCWRFRWLGWSLDVSYKALWPWWESWCFQSSRLKLQRAWLEDQCLSPRILNLQRGFFFISLDFSYWELLSTLVESQCLSLKSWSRNTSNKATERTQVPSKRTIKVQALKLSVSEKICKLHFWCTLPKLGLCLMDMVIRCLYTFIFFFVKQSSTVCDILIRQYSSSSQTFELNLIINHQNNTTVSFFTLATQYLLRSVHIDSFLLISNSHHLLYMDKIASPPSSFLNDGSQWLNQTKDIRHDWLRRELNRKKNHSSLSVGSKIC